MRIVTLDVPGLVAYAERTGQDPAGRQTPAQRAGLAAAVTAWARWAARQQCLPTTAADLLTARIAEIDEAFDRVYADPDLARETMDYLDLVGPDGELLGDLTELAVEHGQGTTSYHEAALDRVTPDPEDFD
jgi:hypothetical protein